MIKDNIEKITDDLSQSFEEAQNTILFNSNEQLMKYITSEDWLKKQITSRGKFKIRLLGIAKKESNVINQKYDNYFRSVLKSGKNDKISQEAIERLNKIKQENKNMMILLSQSVYNSHLKFVNKINVQLQSGAVVELGKLEKTNFLKEQIAKVLNSKEAQEQVKIAYKDGKQFTFKSYMEMNARTTLSQEISNQQKESAVNNGDVFWLCNAFDDCRPSHAEYQGKVYYDERYREMGFTDKQIEEIERAIDERGMLSRQEVEEREPYLCNAPNCRHEFVSIPVSDVISMSNSELLKENNMQVAKATQQRYEASQEQRLYERKIREYKFKMQQQKAILNKDSNNVEAKNLYERNKQFKNKYVAKIKNLISKNPFLERDYSRENVRILREDLGFRANKRSKNK